MIAATDVRKTGRAAAFAVLLLVLPAGVASSSQSPSSAPAVAEGSKLRLLYMGRPGTDREKDFVGFLKKYFDVVQTGNLQTFKEADTQGFDVTLLDWDWNEFKGPRPKLSENFSRPLMTLGVPGGLICSQWRLKTGYL
jgi:hypothetical protein